jgi:Amt family ammonium transporter
VHLTGGVLALVGAKMIGRTHWKVQEGWHGRFRFRLHSIPMAMIGTFILAFGWFGFNPGSTLAGR